ncbi:MAG: non-heme iron oxygenase ferredoxin subunit [Propionibacteriaceae bacterium]|nr:non-heme iron oxygenase ferredoxin subunit [Propionibacteriaceae bacterium]
MADAIKVANVGDIEDEEALIVEADDTGLDKAIAVFRVGEEYFAIDDMCTHAVASLGDGYTDGDIVECPIHAAKFSMQTGEALTLPATKPVCTHQVEVRGDEIWLLPGVPVPGAILS